MPERVTREEKTVELAILKARETLEALRDGEDTTLDIVKLKRPKAKASKHGIKQDRVHANAGGEEFTSGKIKKMTNNDIRLKTEYTQKLVHTLDAQIRLKKKEFEGKEMTAEMKETLRLMTERVDAIYKALTLIQNQKYPKNDDGEKMVKFNEATDRSEDPRDVKIPKGEQKITTSAFKQLEKELKEITQKLMRASVNELGKLEKDLAELSSTWLSYSKVYGRSS